MAAINKKKNISIVIPIFNESENIGAVIEKILNNIKEINFEIIIIDDASTDKPYEKISKFLSLKNIKILKNEKNLGQSFSIYKGIKNSKYETIVTLDGDGQNNPLDILLLTDEYFNDNELFLVGGIRNKRKDNLIKIVSSRVANYIRMFLLSDNCIDTGCALKIFDKYTFLSFPFFDGIHRFLPALFKGYGKKTKFINVKHHPRKFGTSKYGIQNRLFIGIRDIFKVAKIIKEYKNK